MNMRTVAVGASIIASAFAGAVSAGSTESKGTKAMHNCFHSGTAYCRAQLMQKNRLALKKKMEAACETPEFVEELTVQNNAELQESTS